MALPGLRAMVAARPTQWRLLGADKHAQGVPALPPEMAGGTTAQEGTRMTRIRIMCDQTDGTTIKLGTIQSDETGDTLYSAHPRHVPGHHHPRPIALDRPSRTIQPNHQPTRQGRRMSIDLTQQALNALADAGLATTLRPKLRHRIHPRPQRCARARHPHRTSHHSHAPHPRRTRPARPRPLGGQRRRPTVYESGKAVADDVLEWWKQVAASAWGFINGTEAMQ